MSLTNNFSLFIQNVLSFVLLYKYTILFFGAFVEGPIVAILAGFLIHNNQADYLPTFLSLASGDFLADLGWYFVGYFFGYRFVKRFGKYFSITPTVFEKLEKIFRKHDNKILLISKMTMGLGAAIATLVAAGTVRVPFKKFALINAVGEIYWMNFVILVGYFFGKFYSTIQQGFRLGFTIGFIIIASLLTYGFLKFIKQKYLGEKV